MRFDWLGIAIALGLVVAALYYSANRKYMTPEDYAFECRFNYAHKMGHVIHLGR